MNMMRRILSGALAVCLVLSMLPAAAFAEEITEDLPVAETLAAAEAPAETAAPAETEAEATAAPTAAPTEAGTEPPAETAAETEAPTEEPVAETTVPEETVPETTAPEETIAAAAADGAVVASGTCGDDLTWTLDNEGTLTISGTGEMNTGTSNAWENWYNVKTVVIEYGVTSISQWAFCECDDITSITIPESVTSIGAHAFDYCTSLAEVMIPEGVVSIGEYAFSGCRNLPDMTIPASLIHIGAGAFGGCAVYVDPENPQYSSDSCGVLFNKDKTVLIEAPDAISGTYHIPDSVTNIGDRAFFDCENLTGVMIPDSVTNIGDRAFGYSGLTGIAIPRSVTTIGEGIFQKCVNLINVTLQDGMTSIPDFMFSGCSSLKSVDIPDSVTSIGYAAFEYCSSLTSITVPDGVTSIEGCTFYACYDLREVTLSDNITDIGYFAFLACTSLYNITIPASVTRIEKSSFYDCWGLSTIQFLGDAPEFELDPDVDGKVFQSVHPFDTVEAVAYYPGDNATWTEEVRQSAGGDLEWIPYPEDGIIASGECGENLTWTLDLEGTLTISGTGEMYDYDWDESPWYEYCYQVFKVVVEKGVTSIGNNAFNDCVNLTEITIPGSVTRIGYDAFYYCRNLRSITIPAGIETIGECAFTDCYSLTGIYVDPENANYSSDARGVLFDKNQTVLLAAPGAISGDYTIPEGVASIQSHAFFCCNNLTSVTLPDSLVSIGSYAFSGCDSLSGITIPAGVETINSYAFKYCYALTAFYVDPENANYSSDARGVLFDKDQTVLLQAPRAISGEYTIPEGVVSINDEAFEDCGLTSVTLPDSLVSIGYDAFYNCDSLSSITIPAGVETIGSYAFGSCSSLAGIYVAPENANYSSDARGVLFDKNQTVLIKAPEAISGSYEIPEGVSEIRYLAFESCDLTSITIPASVTLIEACAFGWCYGLSEIRFAGSAPQFGYFEDGDQFASIWATVYYPANDPTWTEAVRLNYGGDIEWVSYVPDEPTEPDELGKKVASGTCGDDLTWVLYARGTLIISGSGKMYNYDWYDSPWYDNDRIRAVEIADGVTSIGKHAFYDCSSLTSITLPASTTWIGDYAFGSCSALQVIRFAGSAPEFEYFSGGDQFSGVSATVYYPVNDPSWTEDVRLNYGGDLVWEVYLPDGADLGTVTIEKEYIALKQGQTAQLYAEAQFSELAGRLYWYAEDETVATVDADGMVTAVGPGTTYVVAVFAAEGREVTARCRVDVAESLLLEGISLSANKLTTELFSTDYAEFEILLELPQNMPDAAGARDLDREDLQGVAIESARFTNWDMDGHFELKVLDDRRVAVVPTDDAVYWTFYYPEDKDVAGSYVTAVEVTVDGRTYISEDLTLTVKQSRPKLKVTVPAFNSFYTCQYQPITVTGGTVTEIDYVEMPEWVWLDGFGMELDYDAPLKNASGKAVLEIYTEEFRIPATVTVNVKNTYKEPALKLSASTVTLCQNADYSEGIRLQLQSKDKNVSLADLNIYGIYSTEDNYGIVDFDPQNGWFTLYPKGDDPSGKINLGVWFDDTDNVVTLPLTVKRVPVSLTLSQNTVTLNSSAGDYAIGLIGQQLNKEESAELKKMVNGSSVLCITTAPEDFYGTDLDLRLVGSDKSDKSDSGELEIFCEDEFLYIGTTENTPANAKYTLYISAGGGKEAALKINTTSAKPTVKWKSVYDLDLSFPENEMYLLPQFKNFNVGSIESIAYHITESKGKTVYDEDVQAFAVEDGILACCIEIQDPSAINVKNTYTLYLTLTLADGSTLESSVKLPVKQTNVSLKLSASKLTLNRDILDKASVAVTCATKGYDFTRPVWQLTDSKGNNVTGQLNISWNDCRLTVATTEATPYGASYKLQISPQTGGKAVTLAITIPAENKSAVTGSLKVTGSLDVIRDGTALTVTPTWKNCNDAEREVTLVVRNGSGKDVTDRFNITEEDGKYILTRAGALDHSGKYTVTLTAAFAGGATATASAALKLKMGSAKLTLNAESTPLFAKDKNSRVNISFTSADTALNGVAKVELDPKLQDQFEVFDYGNGQYAIGFKDGKVPNKSTSVNLTLNVWLEGNETAKANASVKVKVSIVR